jgi:putative membrane protein
MAMTSWMAGIFYLPRIFVHFVDGSNQGEDVRRLQIMGRKLYKFISIMAAFTIIFGLWLWLGYGFSGGWLHAKLLFVGFLIAYHFNCGRILKQMEASNLNRSSRYYRLYNELPVLIFLPILIFVVIKPF